MRSTPTARRWWPEAIQMPAKKQPKTKKSADAPQRTWWHPVIAKLFAWLLRHGYRSEEEVTTGSLPKSIDLLTRRQASGKLSDWVQKAAPSVFSRLNVYTLFELKGPTSALRKGDMALMLERAFGWHARQKRKPGHKEVTLIFVAPRLTKGFESELSLLGMRAVEKQAGVHWIEGVPFEIWVISTIEGAKRSEPLLSVMSPQFLKKPHTIIDNLAGSGYVELLSFVIRQVRQFRAANPKLPIPKIEISDMNQFTQDMERRIIEMLGPEHVASLLSVEDRMKGVPVEERIKGVPIEDLERLVAQAKASKSSQN